MIEELSESFTADSDKKFVLALTPAQLGKAPGQTKRGNLPKLLSGDQSHEQPNSSSCIAYGGVARDHADDESDNCTRNRIAESDEETTHAKAEAKAVFKRQDENMDRYGFK
ncbi:unnamed protein product [Soboliphyme baturini]|uniref:Uncharacterized protein n=1 Tax=Soboliphyme baturini TaxID=241478 RepID=A0A183J5L6_9BILA|nr:unnamed protein product [Soboliphyme baturini]